MIVENMAGSQLVEMYGNDSLEMMGFSIGKTFRKAKGVVKRNVGVIATGGLSKLAPKSVQRKINKAARIGFKTLAATSTHGLSLVATKSGRNKIGKAARFTQSKIIRPVAGNKMVQSLVKTAARAGAAYVTGGGSEAALLAARSLRSLKSPASSIRTMARSVAPSSRYDAKAIRDRLERAARAAGRAAVDSVLPPEAPAASPLSMPLILGIGGAGLAVLILAMSMQKKR